jgi:hypothetical protein
MAAQGVPPPPQTPQGTGRAEAHCRGGLSTQSGWVGQQQTGPSTATPTYRQTDIQTYMLQMSKYQLQDLSFYFAIQNIINE